MRKLLLDEQDLQMETTEKLLETLKESNNEEVPGKSNSGNTFEPREASKRSVSNREGSIFVESNAEIEESAKQVVVVQRCGKARQGKLRRSFSAKKSMVGLKDYPFLK